MLDAFTIIAPLAFFAFLGWLLFRLKLLSGEAQKGIGYLVVNFAIPALLFHLIQSHPFHAFLKWHFLGVILLGLGAVFVLAFIVALLGRNKFTAALFSGLNASMLNSALIGIPLLLTLLGRSAAAPLAIINFAVGAIFFPLAIILLEVSRVERDQSLGKVIFSIIKNIVTSPLLMSIPLGLIFSYWQIPLPVVIDRFIAMLAMMASPLALILVGMSLSFSGGAWSFKVVWLSFLKVIALPALMMWLAWHFHLSPLLAICAVVGVAVPSSKSVFLFSQKYQVAQQETAMTVALTTLVSLITLPIFMTLSLHLWH